MSTETTYDLRSPSNVRDWAAYHAIRRHVLFERRGRFGVYDANHPDEHKVGNYPKVLALGHDIIGVIRIDVAPPHAVFRRVAIREDQQRRGHGRTLLRLAERFALQHGCRELSSQVDPAAVAFYARCGFAVRTPVEEGALTVLMSKAVEV